MQQDLSIAEAMIPRITDFNASDPFSASELLLDRAGPLSTVYAPFDYIETSARLVVVGITPGLKQAVNALKAALEARRKGLDLPEILREAKLTASFSGNAIRKNLISLLDDVGVARHLDIPSTAELFRPGSNSVHFTSALRYPVFRNGDNYRGTPSMISTPILRKRIEAHLVEEAQALRHAFWLPLGVKAAVAVQMLADRGDLDPTRVLTGLPHPSGENMERVKVFLGQIRPEDASSRTPPAPLLAARERLRLQIEGIDDGAPELSPS